MVGNLLGRCGGHWPLWTTGWRGRYSVTNRLLGLGLLLPSPAAHSFRATYVFAYGRVRWTTRTRTLFGPRTWRRSGQYLFFQLGGQTVFGRPSPPPWPYKFDLAKAADRASERARCYCFVVRRRVGQRVRSLFPVLGRSPFRFRALSPFPPVQYNISLAFSFTAFCAPITVLPQGATETAFLQFRLWAGEQCARNIVRPHTPPSGRRQIRLSLGRPSHCTWRRRRRRREPNSSRSIKVIAHTPTIAVSERARGELLLLRNRFPGCCQSEKRINYQILGCLKGGANNTSANGGRTGAILELEGRGSKIPPLHSRSRRKEKGGEEKDWKFSLGRTLLLHIAVWPGLLQETMRRAV